MTTTNMASYTFPLDIIVITDTSLLKEKASNSIFSQFLNLFTLSRTRYSWCPNIINYGPYMYNEWARTAGTTSEEGGTRKPSWASQVPPPPYLRFWMTGPALDPALSLDLCTDHAHNLLSPCAASSQAFSVNAFQWRIQDEQTQRLTQTTWPETHWLRTIMRLRGMASALHDKNQRTRRNKILGGTSS